ncbi:phage terminase small subunit [Thauera butanivorans]|uniref:phage terminase small subunit n=1 Tax=Thauera butanivorans TaxID=86174 RepID=UPI0008386036|nr:phage terminase small subunit [Thauera butanivorans]
MNSPARRHYLRTAAALAAAAGAAQEDLPPATANAYELMLRQLAEHRRTLKSIQSIERKVEAKRGFLPVYAPWVDGVLQADRGGQDDVLVTVLVWRIDTGDLAGALTLAEYAVRHGLTPPDHYQRGLPCIVAEEFAEVALRQLAAGELADVAALEGAADLTAGHDMPDEVRAKLYKALGYALREAAPQQALDYLHAALKAHDKVGVKKDIERLEREIRKAAEPPATEQPNTAPATGQG